MLIELCTCCSLSCEECAFRIFSNKERVFFDDDFFDVVRIEGGFE